MADTDFCFDGLDELEQALAQMIEQDYPEEFKKMVVQVAYTLQSEVKENTPVDTSRLADSWVVGEIRKVGDEYIIEVYTNVDYALPVEHGHRTRGGKSFVPGRHMMAVSLAKVNEALPAYLQEWLSDFISTHQL